MPVGINKKKIRKMIFFLTEHGSLEKSAPKHVFAQRSLSFLFPLWRSGSTPESYDLLFRVMLPSGLLKHKRLRCGGPGKAVCSDKGQPYSGSRPPSLRKYSRKAETTQRLPLLSPRSPSTNRAPTSSSWRALRPGLTFQNH